MDRIARLEAVEAIRTLKARYFRYLDTKAWDELPALFTARMRVVTPAGDIHSEGGATYAAGLRHSLESATSVHHGPNGEIEIVDDDHATAVWAMRDEIVWTDRHPKQGWKRIVGTGHYRETYRIEDGAWRIDTLTLTRLTLDIVWPADDPRAGAA